MAEMQVLGGQLSPSYLLCTPASGSKAHTCAPAQCRPLHNLGLWGEKETSQVKSAHDQDQP
jgi:hypothetical protein